MGEENQQLLEILETKFTIIAKSITTLESVTGRNQTEIRDALQTITQTLEYFVLFPPSFVLT